MKNGLIKILAVSTIMFIGFNYIDGDKGISVRGGIDKISTSNLTAGSSEGINKNSNGTSGSGNNINNNGLKNNVDDFNTDGTSSEGINIREKDKTNKADEKLILVNSKSGLNKNYVPNDLVVPNITFSVQATNEEKQISSIILKPLENLVNEAKNEGIILLGNSGYRSYKLQQDVFKDSIKNFGREHTNLYVAKAGFSEHQSGLAIDITNEHDYFAKGTVEADWLAENSYKFGFIIRYPEGKTSITGIEYEPWHIRYVGEEAAKYIYNNDLTLEEYLDAV